MLALPLPRWVLQSAKPERALPTHLLPTNNNRSFLDLEDVHSATVLLPLPPGGGAAAQQDQKNSSPPAVIGFGLFHKCTANQVYCSLISVSKQFEHGFVNIERVADPPEGKNKEAVSQRHILLKLVEMRDSLPDLSGLPQYFTAFAEPEARPLLQCIVEEFVKAHVGNKDVELRRNFTVDLYDSESCVAEHPDHLWRDFAGFIVADRFRYCELEVDRQAALAALDVAAGEELPRSVSLRPLAPSNRALFHDYDQSVAVMGREEYLDFLLDIDGIIGVIAIDEQQRQPLGYMLAYGERVLQCYAEDERIASALLGAACRSLATAHVSLFLRLGAEQPLLARRLLPAAARTRRIRRLHSRSMPATVKWTKVHAPGIGLHLF